MEIPQPEYPFKHRLPVQIRFNDIDLLGHVNNAVYSEFFDLGKTRYFRQLMGDDGFDYNAISLVIVHIDMDFCAPTFIEDAVEVLTAVTHIGEKSLVVEQRIVSAGNDDDVKCISRTVLAGYDHRTRTSAPITDDWRRRISTFEGRTF